MGGGGGGPNKNFSVIGTYRTCLSKKYLIVFDVRNCSTTGITTDFLFDQARVVSVPMYVLFVVSYYLSFATPC